MSALRKWLFTGLLVIVPGVITAWVLNWIVSTLDQTLQILPGAWHPDKLLGIHIPGFGVVCDGVPGGQRGQFRSRDRRQVGIQDRVFCICQWW